MIWALDDVTRGPSAPDAFDLGSSAPVPVAAVAKRTYVRYCGDSIAQMSAHGISGTARWPNRIGWDSQMTVTEDTGSRRPLREAARLEALSDAVFAIALTLLVLDLHVPAEKGRFAHSIAHDWPAYLAYVAAFLTIACIWLTHHDLFGRIHRVDAGLNVFNLLLLLGSSIIPWPAAVISAAIISGDHHDQVAAVLLYAGISLLVPLAWLLLYRHVLRTPTLLITNATPMVRKDSKRPYVGFALYPIAGAVGAFFPTAGLILFLLIPLLYIFT